LLKYSPRQAVIAGVAEGTGVEGVGVTVGTTGVGVDVEVAVGSDTASVGVKDGAGVAAVR